MTNTISNQQLINSAFDQAVYSQLLVKFQPKVIETEEEYKKAHQQLLALMKKTDRSIEETAIIKLLAKLLKEFDDSCQDTLNVSLSPKEILVHLMEQNQIKQIDLVGKLGSKGVVSEIVNGKRSISKSQAKTLAEIFQVSPSLFI